MKIQHVIFDVGNVLVRWTPLEIIQSTFPQWDPLDFYAKMRPAWIRLNLGELSLEETITHYTKIFNLPKESMEHFMVQLKAHQTPLEGSLELLEKLQNAKINLFSITDNVKEIMEYHKAVSQFPKYFKDIIISSEVGVLKPNPRIYQCLLTKHHLNPSQSLFIDDTLVNVEGARALGIHAFQFIDIPSCEKELLSFLGTPW